MAQVPVTETAKNGPISRARASLAALETLERLRQAPHTPPAPDDLAALRGWSGWGPLAPALESSRTGSWKQIGERIAYLLPEEHYNHGIQATYNAFYTPPQITAACWQILTDLGFAGRQLLEPGCGAGAFMAATPAQISAAWTGVERDPTTAAIAGLLHPNATIHARRLEETPLPTHGADAVLGNVPFGDTKVYDPTTPSKLTANLHNYFIYRSVKALRPGGIAILVTSRYTMDAASDTAQAARLLISREAELLGAIRLPNDALTSGGTEPLVDVLVLRRRRADEPPHPEQDRWITTGPSVGGQQVNTYFLANPSMVLGELAEDSAPRWGRTLRVDARPDDAPVEIAMASAGRAIVRQATEAGRGWRIDAGASPITAQSAPFALRSDGKKEGSFHLIDGIVHEVVEAQLVPVVRPGKELPKLVALRDAVLALLGAETDHTRPDTQLQPLRAEANRRYDAYVKAHGYLNRYTVVEGKSDEDGVAASSRRRPAMGGFRRDPDFVTVLALEDFDDESRTAAKAALLTRRVNRPRQRATHAESPAEAIALCRDELGRFDLDRVAELLGASKAEAERQIAEVAFIDPATDQWVPADEYLTGNVRTKLARSKTAAALAPQRFGRNVPALEAVIPADLQPEQITANLGAPWVPAGDVQEFAQELLGFPARIWHEPRTHTWSVSAGSRAQESAIATTEWGTGRLNAYQLLECGLNGKAPVVYDVIDDKRVRNQDETVAAKDRLDVIAARFSAWVWEDPDRADRLAHAYNQTFNAIVPRRFDGTHLTFPGLDSAFDPYPHQRDMVARMISGSDALCPYPVGTGKTATMFMAAIKLKALGLASKPLIIVVPSTLEQIARDGKRLFPHARILMAGREDLATARARKLFAARCAMEDWDAVVMSHPSFTSLPVHPTVKAHYLAAVAADYRSALIYAKSDDAEPRKIKQIAKMVDNLEAEAKALLSHATDDGVFFEHLGTDYLLVDEMHYFKNLGVPVHTDGFAIQGSKRAQDLDMKLGWQRRRHPGKAVVTGFTGTPVSNTLLETFILQHYLQPDRLEELGLASADAWAASFVRFATGVEITPDGGFRLGRRPVEIVNVPDLMQTVAEFAELRPPETFPVVRPEVKRHIAVVDASDTVRDFVHSLAERADDIRSGSVPSSQDNMLKICSDGRKVALHESLVGLEPEDPGKIGAVTANVARIYHQTKDLDLPGDGAGIPGRLQLVFCDLGTPNKDKGSQVYGLLRAQLTAAGVPAGRIRFIHEATTDAQRLVLFDQCNKGEVSVLLGSTDKLGVGVNIQRRAIALHHVDAPWRPDQVEQREGRVWRPKNLNKSVEIYRYVTQDSFDAFMWQTLERKEKTLRPILSGQVTARSVEDIGDAALDYGQIKAVATGNPLLGELNQVSIKVKNLSSLAASHQRNQRRLRSDIQTLTMQASAAATAAEALEAVAQAAAQSPDTSPWLDTRGNPVPKEDEAALIGELAESTVTKGYCDASLQWRALTISFAATKQWRDTDLSARITVADRHRITAPLNVAWAVKGQHWRIRDAIAAAVTDAHRTAAATRANIEILGQRIAENEAALGQPFADQAALDAARTRRAVLDAAIREQAQKDEEARRTRSVRAPADAASAANPQVERDALLRRLHSAMTTIVEKSALNAAPTAPEAITRLQAPDGIERPAQHDAVQIPAEPASTSELAANDVLGTQAIPVDLSERIGRGGDNAPRAEEPPTPQPVLDSGLAGDQTPDAEATSEGGSERIRQIGDGTGETDEKPATEQLPATRQTAEPEAGEAADPPNAWQAPDKAKAAPVRRLPGEGEEATSAAPPTAALARENNSSNHEPRRATPRRQERRPRRATPKTNPAGAKPETETEPPSRLPEHESASSQRAAGSVDAALKPHAQTLLRSPAPQPSAPTARQPSRPAAPPQRSELFEQATDLALQGFAVFPLRPGTKKPLLKDWEKKASTDPRQIARWWNTHPRANIAIACGPSNLLVVDLDAAKKPGGPRHGQQTLTTLAAGREIPRTFTVSSARGGRHLYFRQPDGATLRNTTGSNTAGLGPLIDTRGHGGFIVAPGSLFNGGTYRIERDAAVAPLPSWIISELTTRESAAPPVPEAEPSHTPVSGLRRAAYGDAALRRSAETVATAPEGTRNDTLNREAFRIGRLVGGHVLDDNDAATALRRAGRKAGLPPGEVETTIASGLTAGISHPRSIPHPTPDRHTKNTAKESAMSTTTTNDQQHTTNRVTAPPNAGDLYPQLSATGSRAFQDALRTLWRLGPTAIALPETSTEPVRAAWRQAGEQMAGAIREHETTDASDPHAPAETTTAAAQATPTHVREETTAAPASDFNFEDIWADVRASIERARQALPDWSQLNTTDDLKPAIDEALRYLAQAPIPRSTTNQNDGAAASVELPPAGQRSSAQEPGARPAATLDEHLAAVDAAYANAKSANIPADRPEWAGITAIHSAIHNLWDTIKAAAGTYWAELSADIRLHGLLTTLATRAMRAIANLANSAADRLDQRTAQQPGVREIPEPGLREAYINARNQVRAHAATHEWQRITALWGTINTLTRQTGDPAIRAVVARSADAISDYADTLARKTSQHSHTGAADALKTLATAAERHASSLRTSDLDHEPHVGQQQAPPTVARPAQSLDGADRTRQNSEAQALQARARQVAQHAQTRLGQTPRKATAAPRRAHNVNSPNGQSNAMKPTQPNPTRPTANIQAR